MLKKSGMSSILKIMKAWQLLLDLRCLIQRVFWNVGVPDYVIIVEIPEEVWDVWTHSNVIRLSILKDNVLKEEIFLDILHCIANIINTKGDCKKHFTSRQYC